MMRKRIFFNYWLPLLVYCLLIVTLSSIPGDEFGIPSFALSDKIAHAAEYALLGALCARFWVNKGRKAGAPSAFLFSISYSFFFGMSDEIHQSFISGRFCSIWDLAADLLGGALGALLFIWWWKRTIK